MKSGSIQRNNAKGLAHGGNARRGCVREWSRFGITARPNPSAQFFSEHAHWWDVNRYPASFWLLSSSWGYGSSLFHQNEIQTILTLFLLMKNSICIAMSHGRLSIPSLSWPPLNPQDRCTPPPCSSCGHITCVFTLANHMFSQSILLHDVQCRWIQCRITLQLWVSLRRDTLIISVTILPWNIMYWNFIRSVPIEKQQGRICKLLPSSIFRPMAFHLKFHFMN